MNGIKLDQSDIDDIVRMYCKENYNCSEIAEYIGCHRTTVFACLNRLNVYEYGKTRLRQRTLEILKQYNEGLNYDEIASNFKTSSIAIRNIVRYTRKTRPELITRSGV